MTQYQVPPPPPTPPMPRRKTNSFAIVSLVCSLIWLAGIGSVLAVIFGSIAIRQLRGPRRYEEGEGMALAGLIVGVLGILGAVLTGILISKLSSSIQDTFAPRTDVFQMGETASLPWMDSIAGYQHVTVYSFEFPVISNNVPKLKGDKVYAVADIQVCAGATGAALAPSDFVTMLDVPMPGLIPPSASIRIAARQPALAALDAAGPNSCIRGFVTFVMPRSAQPQAVEYQSLFHSYRWVIPPG
jgi:hypothetical protein